MRQLQSSTGGRTGVKNWAEENGRRRRHIQEHHIQAGKRKEEGGEEPVKISSTKRGATQGKRKTKPLLKINA